MYGNLAQAGLVAFHIFLIYVSYKVIWKLMHLTFQKLSILILDGRLCPD